MRVEDGFESVGGTPAVVRRPGLTARLLLRGGSVLTLGAKTANHAQADVLIEDGTIDTNPWITHRTSFDEVIGEFEGRG